jgi:hypothetical protein
MDLFNDDVIDYTWQLLRELKYNCLETRDILVRQRYDIKTVKDGLLEIRDMINNILFNELPKLDF